MDGESEENEERDRQGSKKREEGEKREKAMLIKQTISLIKQTILRERGHTYIQLDIDRERGRDSVLHPQQHIERVEAQAATVTCLPQLKQRERERFSYSTHNRQNTCTCGVFPHQLQPIFDIFPKSNHRMFLYLFPFCQLFLQNHTRKEEKKKNKKKERKRASIRSTLLARMKYDRPSATTTTTKPEKN